MKTIVSLFLVGLEKLPFFEEVVHKTHKKIPNFNDLLYNEKCVEFIKTMLNEDRLNFSSFPKGLLPFHRYKKHVSTAFEEHLFEAALYASGNNQADLLFTISEKHNHKFDEEFSVCFFFLAPWFDVNEQDKDDLDHHRLEF